MAFNGQLQVVGVHAAAVVLDQDARQPAHIAANIDLVRTGVDGVFDKFLDGRSRTFHDLTGGDAVDGILGQTLNTGHPYKIAGVALPVSSRLSVTPFGQGMVRFDDITQALIGDVGIDLGRRNIGVPEKRLDRA